MAIIHWAYKAALEHEAVLGLLALAFIITMRPTLPEPFCRWSVLEWSYEWLHDALAAFISFRTHPSVPNVPPGASLKQSTQTVQTTETSVEAGKG
jgi:hypothetical protein